jgi:hypothetical protein
MEFWFIIAISSVVVMFIKGVRVRLTRMTVMGLIVIKVVVKSQVILIHQVF